MDTAFEKIRAATGPYRRQILEHPLYMNINEPADIKLFMQFHVFAVWDFMSLLKALQNHLTCTRVPWVPVGDADTRFLINEIVVGEESDVDENGERRSHFEMYLRAMEQCGADTSQMQQLIGFLQSGSGVASALKMAGVAPEAETFVNFTFGAIAQDKAHILAAVFTFGREDLIPGMFYALVNELNQRFPGMLSAFKYYLDRHIEVDGDHHSHLALEMTARLCGNDPLKWQEASAMAVESLKARLTLWDGALRAICAHKTAGVH
ncbi:MAG: DUF3050 domain-containing protein [Bacteroidia bacterium]|nr:DUF3050 domain-containing protein [Bacteroidia bacterium]